MLSVLSTGGDAAETKYDELHIFIRKMLSKNTLHDKRVGVIGATMMIRALTEDRRNTVEESMMTSAGDTESQASILWHTAGYAWHEFPLYHPVVQRLEEFLGPVTPMMHLYLLQAIHLLALVKNQILGDDETGVAKTANVAEDVLAAGLLYDELASVCLVNRVSLPESLLEWISENITERFQSAFLTDTESTPVDPQIKNQNQNGAKIWI